MKSKTITKSINVKSKIVNKELPNKTVKKIEKPKMNIAKKITHTSTSNAKAKVQHNIKNPQNKIKTIKPKSLAIVKKSSSSKYVEKGKAKALSNIPSKLRSAKPKTNVTSPNKSKPLPTPVKTKSVNIVKSIKAKTVSKPKPKSQSKTSKSSTSAKSNNSKCEIAATIPTPMLKEEEIVTYPANTMFISTMIKLCEKYNLNTDNLGSWGKIFENISTADGSAEILKDFYTNPGNALKRMNDITAVCQFQ